MPKCEMVSSLKGRDSYDIVVEIRLEELFREVRYEASEVAPAKSIRS